MKKRNLALLSSAALLSLALAGSLGAVVVASAKTISSSSSGAQEVTVTYSVSDSWTVTIPDSITVGDAGTSQKLSATDVLLGEGQTLTVTVKSANNWTLKDADEPDGTVSFGYDLKVDGSTISSSSNAETGATALTVEAGTTSSGEKTVTATLKEGDQNSGKYSTNGKSYTDTLTFEVTVSGD